MGNFCGAGKRKAQIAADLAAAERAAEDEARRTAEEQARREEEAAAAARQRAQEEQEERERAAAIVAAASAATAAAMASSIAAIAAQDAENAATRGLHAADEVRLAVQGGPGVSRRRYPKYEAHAAWVGAYNRMYAKVRSRRAPFLSSKAASESGSDFTSDEEQSPGKLQAGDDGQAKLERDSRPAVASPAALFAAQSYPVTEKNVSCGLLVQRGPDWDFDAEAAAAAAAEADGEEVDAARIEAIQRACTVADDGLRGVVVGYRLLDGGRGFGVAPVRPGMANVEWSGTRVRAQLGANGLVRAYAIGRNGRHEIAQLVDPSLRKMPNQPQLALLAGVVIAGKRLSAKARKKTRMKSMLKEGSLSNTNEEEARVATVGSSEPTGARNREQQVFVPAGLEPWRGEGVDLDTALQRAGDTGNRASKPKGVTTGQDLSGDLRMPAAATSSPTKFLACKFMQHCKHRHCCPFHHGEALECHCPELSCPKAHPLREPFDDGTLTCEAAIIKGRGFKDDVTPLSIEDFETKFGEQLDAVAQGARKVTALNFEGRALCLRSVERIADAIRDSSSMNVSVARRRQKNAFCRLRSLQLASSEIGVEGLQLLADALNVNASITVIGLARNALDARACEVLCNALESNVANAVTSLDLGGNMVGKRGADGVGRLLELPEDEAKLRVVDLRFNQIGVAGGRRIARALSPNQSLTSLNLYQNHVGDDGCTAIAESLGTNATLETLNLGLNEIGDQGCFALGQMLRRHNTTLTYLDLRLNTFSSEGEHMLTRALKKNAVLKKLPWTKDHNDEEMRITVGYPKQGM